MRGDRVEVERGSAVPNISRALPPRRQLVNRGGAQLRETVQPVSIPAGWLSIASAIDVDVFDGGVLVGSSRMPRIMLEAGLRTLELVNEQAGFRNTREVRISSGKVEQIAVDLPVGTIHINAVPWAEVWIDGRSIGQTPIGNRPVAIGTHRIVFRHPVLGEKETTTVVKADTPTRLSVSLTEAAP